MNKVSALAQVVILSLGLPPLQVGDCVAQAGPNKVSQAVADAKTAIVNARFDWAIDRLEQELATKPDDPEALTFLATARAYKERDFLKAKQYFEDAIGKGGGASFVAASRYAGWDCLMRLTGWPSRRFTLWPRGRREFRSKRLMLKARARSCKSPCA